MPFMWGDTLLAAERAHLLRLILWGGTSVLAGTAVVATLRARAQRSLLLERFAFMTACWGAVDLAIALLSVRNLAVRDLASATRLDRFLWLNVGLDVGYVLAGATLMFAGWRFGRRPGAIGSGAGIIVQGLALVVLDLVLVSQISR